MSRAVRTARGAFGALAATLLAAVSHACAGGEITPLAVIATALLALPLCVLFAGKVGSLWRLALAVTAAQFVYHWSFSGLGASVTLNTNGDPVSPHAVHLGMLAPASFTPDIAASSSNGDASAWMWAAHALAAVLTIALMHRGEQAALHLARVLRTVLPAQVPSAVRLPVRPAILEFFTALPSCAEPAFLSAISHRGPPAAPAFASAF